MTSWFYRTAIGYNNQYESIKPSITGASFSLAKKSAYYSSNLSYEAKCNEQEIKALMTNDENGQHSFTAILLPEKYDSGAKFLSLTTADGTIFVVNATGILTTDGLESGKTYTFDLVVGKDIISIENVTVNPWNGNDWDKKEGIADEQYSFEVNNNVPTLKVYKDGLISQMDDNAPLAQNIKKYNNLIAQGSIYFEDICKLLEWVSNTYAFKLDLSQAEECTGAWQLPAINYNYTTIVLPQEFDKVEGNFFKEIKGNLIISLKACKKIPDVHPSFDMPNDGNVTISITNAQDIEGTKWSIFTVKKEDY